MCYSSIISSEVLYFLQLITHVNIFNLILSIMTISLLSPFSLGSILHKQHTLHMNSLYILSVKGRKLLPYGLFITTLDLFLINSHVLFGNKESSKLLVVSTTTNLLVWDLLTLSGKSYITVFKFPFLEV